MANIRGVNDIRQGLLGNRDPTSAMLMQTQGMLGTAAEARRETFATMLKMLFCPLFERKSFTAAICVLDLVLFLACCVYDSNAGAFLSPTNEALLLFGARDNEKLREMQVWRWVTPIFLHSGFNHIFMNLLFTLMFVSRLEYGLGRRVCIVIYFLSGVAGNLLGSLISSDETRSVGASGSIFGVIGATIGWILLNWSALNGNPSRNMSLIVLLVITGFSLLLGFIQTNTDNAVHLGGVLSGTACAFAFLPTLNAQTLIQKRQSLAAKASLVLFFIFGLVYFYI